MYPGDLQHVMGVIALCARYTSRVDCISLSMAGRIRRTGPELMSAYIHMWFIDG